MEVAEEAGSPVEGPEATMAASAAAEGMVMAATEEG